LFAKYLGYAVVINAQLLAILHKHLAINGD
jgi:hypothetical protein